MVTPYVGEVRAFGFNFAPVGWAFCNGDLLSISGNETLYTLIGTVYGGNGQTNFALPNLNGRVPIDTGPSYPLGAQGGTSTVTLTIPQMPQHNHAVMASTVTSTTPTPGPTVVHATSSAPSYTTYLPAATSTVDNLAATAVSIVGNSLPHNNMMPTLTVNFCIALYGIFPTQG